MALYIANKGRITPGLVAEMLQNLTDTRDSGCLTLTRESDMCRLFFDQGSIVHSELSYMETGANTQSDLSGEQGMRLMGKLLAWQSGTYQFNPELRTGVKTLDLSVDWKKALKIMNSVGDIDRFERRATVFLQARTAKRGGSKTSQEVSTSASEQVVQSVDLKQIPVRLKTYLSPQHKTTSMSTVRRQMAGRGGGFVRQQSKTEDKKVQLFEAINGQRSLLDLARFLSWSIEEIKDVLTQLHSEGAVDFS